MDIPAGTTVWLGQRNNIHGFFKVWIALSSAVYDLYSYMMCSILLEETHLFLFIWDFSSASFCQNVDINECLLD